MRRLWRRLRSPLRVGPWRAWQYRRGYSTPVKERTDVYYCGECNYQFAMSDGTPWLDECDCPDGEPSVIHVYADRVRVVYGG